MNSDVRFLSSAKFVSAYSKRSAGQWLTSRFLPMVSPVPLTDSSRDWVQRFGVAEE